MNKLMELVKSRKAMAAVGSMAMSVWGYTTGEVSMEVMVGAISLVVSFWIKAQSTVDAARILPDLDEE